MDISFILIFYGFNVCIFKLAWLMLDVASDITTTMRLPNASVRSHSEDTNDFMLVGA